MMKLFKKYWFVAVGVILAFLGYIGIAKKRNTNKINLINDDIKQNDAKQNQVAGKVEVIEDQRAEVKQDIAKTETTITATETAKNEITVEPKKTAAAAKKNILDKISKKSKQRKS